MSGERVSASPPRCRPLSALFAANAVSMVGNQIAGLAIPWFVLTGGGSGADIGLVGFFTTLPVVLAAFFGGAVVDRLGPARASVLADLLSGVAVALIPLLHATVGLTLWPLIGLVFLGALLDAPGVTARQSLLPDLTAAAGMPPERANAAYQTIQRASAMLGPVGAGVLIAVVGAANVLWIDAATFVVSAGLVARLIPRGSPTSSPAGGRGRYLDEVRAGVRFVRRDPLLARLVGLIAVLNLLEAPVWGVIVPVFAAESFGSARALGLLYASLGAGSVLAAIVYGAVGHRLPRWPVFATGFLFIGLPQFVLAFAPPLWLAMATLALIGAAAGPINPIFMTVRQERVPPELRGRVFGAITALCYAAIPLGLLTGGLLLDLIGLRASLLAIAALYVAVSVGMRFSPTLRGMDGPRPGSG